MQTQQFRIRHGFESLLSHSKDSNSHEIEEKTPCVLPCPRQQMSSLESSEENHKSHSCNTTQTSHANPIAHFNFESEYFNSIQNLDLTRCSFGRNAVEFICCEGILKNLKSLNLSENPIRNDGVKYIVDTTKWTKLNTLILCGIQIDHQGAGYLSMNENWVNLRRLDLSQNPQIGDLGAMHLSLNLSWTSLTKLSLRGCNISSLGIKALARNKKFGGMFSEEGASAMEIREDQNYNRKKVNQ